MLNYRIQRILKPLNNYYTIEECDLIMFNKFHIDSDEEILGIYKKNESEILITTKGVHFVNYIDKQEVYITYTNIKSVKISEEKSSASSIFINDRINRCYQLFIQKEPNSKFSDIWEIDRFFQRIIDDNEKNILK